jgi:hypothetical protein
MVAAGEYRIADLPQQYLLLQCIHATNLPFISSTCSSARCCPAVDGSWHSRFVLSVDAASIQTLAELRHSQGRQLLQ